MFQIFRAANWQNAFRGHKCNASMPAYIAHTRICPEVLDDVIGHCRVSFQS